MGFVVLQLITILTVQNIGISDAVQTLETSSYPNSLFTFGHWIIMWMLCPLNTVNFHRCNVFVIHSEFVAISVLRGFFCASSPLPPVYISRGFSSFGGERWESGFYSLMGRQDSVLHRCLVCCELAGKLLVIWEKKIVGFAMSAIVVVHYTFQLELVVIRWKYGKVNNSNLHRMCPN
jgi:hypothetical protein